MCMFSQGSDMEEMEVKGWKIYIYIYIHNVFVCSKVLYYYFQYSNEMVFVIKAAIFAPLRRTIHNFNQNYKFKTPPTSEDYGIGVYKYIRRTWFIVLLVDFFICVERNP